MFHIFVPHRNLGRELGKVKRGPTHGMQIKTVYWLLRVADSEQQLSQHGPHDLTTQKRGQIIGHCSMCSESYINRTDR